MFLRVVLFFAFSFAWSGPVSYYGKLQASGNKLIGSKTGSTAVQVRGVSFGWSNTTWESGRFYQAAYAANAVEHMVKDWKAEVVRAAYGATTSIFSNSTATENRTSVERIVNAAIENDVYAIIDWHSEKAPNELQNSKDFFEYMAQKYGDKDNVIFEIYNEPTGTPWASIKTYAETIIPIIRQYSSNLILVGTPTYSQQIQNVVGNAINDPNVGYVVHFYAYSHPLKNWLNNLNTALNSNLPIFVTEYGTTHSDGGLSTSNPSHYETHSAANSDEWHTFMDEKKISSAAWNINDKTEGSAFFGIQGAAKKFDMQSWADKTKMTASGQYIFDKLNKYYESAPWKSAQTPIKPLAVEDLAINGDASIEIFSLQGKKMGNSLSNLNSGIYILLLKQGSQTKTMKIVKK